MKFFSEKPFQIVWDKDANKKLCKFHDGVFETKEKTVQNKLIQLGYKHEKDREELKEELEKEIKAEKKSKKSR